MTAGSAHTYLQFLTKYGLGRRALWPLMTQHCSMGGHSATTTIMSNICSLLIFHISGGSIIQMRLLHSPVMMQCPVQPYSVTSQPDSQPAKYKSCSTTMSVQQAALAWASQPHCTSIVQRAKSGSRNKGDCSHAVNS